MSEKLVKGYMLSDIKNGEIVETHYAVYPSGAMRMLSGIRGGDRNHFFGGKTKIRPAIGQWVHGSLPRAAEFIGNYPEPYPLEA